MVIIKFQLWHFSHVKFSQYFDDIVLPGHSVKQPHSENDLAQVYPDE